MGLTPPYSGGDRAGRKMKVYRFPPLTPARLFRESAVSYYLRALKYPNFDKPFTRLNLATMDWPPLLGLCLAQLRHRYSDYETRLAAGEDREMLHREIHAAAFHAFPWLRADPRPLPPPPVRLALDEAAATLAHLKDFEHSLTETLGSPGVRNSRKSRESVKEMIVKLRAEIAELTAIITSSGSPRRGRFVPLAQPRQAWITIGSATASTRIRSAISALNAPVAARASIRRNAPSRSARDS